MNAVTRPRNAVFAAAALVALLSGCGGGGGHATRPARDTHFGTGGKLRTGVHTPDGRSNVSPVAVEPDGKVVVAGFSDGVVLDRYTSAGKPDPSFGKGGEVLVGSQSEPIAEITALAIQPDGKIVAAGRGGKGGREFAVARFTQSGAPDTTFGAGGTVLANPGQRAGEATTVLIQRDGKIVVAGSIGTGCCRLPGPDRTALVRFTRGGALDTSFGRGGTVRTDISTSSDGGVPAAAIAADGKLVVAGAGWRGMTNTAFSVESFLKNGALDTSFGKRGIVSGGLGSQWTDIATAVAIQPDGKAVVAGYDFWGNFLLARYTTAGKFDRSFGHRGKVVTHFGSKKDRVAAYAVGIQADGKIVVSGFTTTDRAVTPNSIVARYTKNGALDESFGTKGHTVTKFFRTYYDPVLRGFSNALAILPSGRIVVAAVLRPKGGKNELELARYLP